MTYNIQKNILLFMRVIPYYMNKKKEKRTEVFKQNCGMLHMTGVKKAKPSEK